MKKIYIGSTRDLRKRLREYLNLKYITKDQCMIINKALLKYKYENFNLKIL
jgi:group I intron endonuclease